MKDKHTYYDELVKSFPKKTIKEFNSLLTTRTMENKNLFLEGFIHYIYQMALRIEETNVQYFNAYYNFEDLINDGIILASELFLDEKKTFTNFNCFEKCFFTVFSKKIANAYFIKIGYSWWIKIRDVYDYKMQGYDIDEIREITGYSTRILNNVKIAESLERARIADDTMEDEVINAIIVGKIIREVTLIMRDLPYKDEELLNCLYGLNNHEIMNQHELARSYCISPQRISQLHNVLLDKIRKEQNKLKQYVK